MDCCNSTRNVLKNKVAKVQNRKIAFVGKGKRNSKYIRKFYRKRKK